MLCLLLATALAATAFAHRAPLPLDAGLVQFLATGGTLQDLCRDGQHDPGTENDCEACRLPLTGLPVSSAHLPHACDFPFVARLAQRLENPVPARVRDPARGTRAPPLV